MLKWFTDWRDTRRTAKLIHDNPILGATLDSAAKTLNDKSAGLGKYLSDSEKANLLERVAKETLLIISSDNPVQAARLKLGDWVCNTALLEVLVLDENTGWKFLLSVKGISGELKSHLLELSKVNEDLSKLVFHMKGAVTQDHLRDVLMFRYWESHLFMQAFNVVRLRLGDMSLSKATDWFKPFFISMCIFAESIYRDELGLPSAFDGKERVSPLAHSTWMNLIEKGEKELRWAWERQWESDFHLGASPYAGLEL